MNQLQLQKDQLLLQLGNVRFNILQLTKQEENLRSQLEDVAKMLQGIANAKTQEDTAQPFVPGVTDDQSK